MSEPRMSAEQEREIRALDGGIDPLTMTAAQAHRRALLRELDAVRAELAGATAPEGVTADDLAWLREQEARSRREADYIAGEVPKYEATRPGWAKEDREREAKHRASADRYARILAALAALEGP